MDQKYRGAIQRCTALDVGEAGQLPCRCEKGAGLPGRAPAFWAVFNPSWSSKSDNHGALDHSRASQVNQGCVFYYSDKNRVTSTWYSTFHWEIYLCNYLASRLLGAHTRGLRGWAAGRKRLCDRERPIDRIVSECGGCGLEAPARACGREG